jgi:DNA-binding beta-propeller fold protein YncE
MLKFGRPEARADRPGVEPCRTRPFDETIATQGSYLNDVRISPDGRFVYITESGVRGAIVVVDTASGAVRHVLDGDPRTQADKSVAVKVDGKPLQQTD